MKKFTTHWSTFIIAFTDLAGKLVLRIYRNEKVFLNKQPLVLHSDSGSPMKGATMVETLKCRPNYQPKGFESLEDARIWCKLFVH